MPGVGFGEKVLVKYVGGQLVGREDGQSTASMQRDLSAIAKRSANLTVPFNAFQNIWFEQNRRMFKAQGIPRWVPLSKRYAAWKAVKYPGTGILHATGRLERSLTSRTGDTVYAVTPRTLRVGTRRPWSRIHQEGGDRVPRRPHIQLFGNSFELLAEKTMAYILGRGRRFGR